jgi:cytochrome P450
MSRLPFCYRLLKGTLARDMRLLYEKYGDVVRIAPDELAMANPAAWNDIMGHRTSGDEMAKSEHLYRPIKAVPTNISNADRDEHARLRRQLSHGFSDKSMRAQEPLIQQYIDLLIRRLREHARAGAAALDIADWYCYITFDIIGHLAFGEPFGCLERSRLHSWISMHFAALQHSVALQASSYYPALQVLLMALIPRSLRKKRRAQRAIVRAKVARRMRSVQERPDFLEGLLQKKEEWVSGVPKTNKKPK